MCHRGLRAAPACKGVANEDPFLGAFSSDAVEVTTDCRELSGPSGVVDVSLREYQAQNVLGNLGWDK